VKVLTPVGFGLTSAAIVASLYAGYHLVALVARTYAALPLDAKTLPPSLKRHIRHMLIGMVLFTVVCYVAAILDVILQS
jgi:hypothetical protein